MPPAAGYCGVIVTARLLDPVRSGHATAVCFTFDYFGGAIAEAKAHAGYTVPRASHFIPRPRRDFRQPCVRAG